MKSFTAKIGIIIIAILVLTALFAPWLAPHNPGEYHLDKSFAGSSMEYPLGNDSDGRDILSRIIYGTRISLGIGMAVVSVSLIIGCIVGMAAGYAGGFFDKIFSFVSDVFLAFPGFLFAVAIAAFLEPAVVNVIIILCIKGWVSFARLVRGQTLAIKERSRISRWWSTSGLTSKERQGVWALKTNSNS